MKKVDWNRTRGLVALAVLLGVIGFGGYAASMAQEPTPAKETQKSAPTPCSCKGNEGKSTTKTLEGYQTCPFYCFATVNEGGTTLYYHYAIRYIASTCEFDGLSMLVLDSEVNANGACGGEKCIGHTLLPPSGKLASDRPRDIVVNLPNTRSVPPFDPAQFKVQGGATETSQFFCEVPLRNQGRKALVIVKTVQADPAAYNRGTIRPPKVFHLAFEVNEATDRGSSRTIPIDRVNYEGRNEVRFEMSGVEFTAILADQ
ncbi:MAG: hypothetical protein U1A77_01940 [Pirellulales bacterium]